MEAGKARRGFARNGSGLEQSGHYTGFQKNSKTFPEGVGKFKTSQGYPSSGDLTTTSRIILNEMVQSRPECHTKMYLTYIYGQCKM
jgi:hypothetical protein